MKRTGESFVVRLFFCTLASPRYFSLDIIKEKSFSFAFVLTYSYLCTTKNKKE